MIKFLYSNRFDSATVTSLNAATNFPVANVQDRFLKKTYRSTGLSNQWLKFDLGSAQSVDMLTFFYNNLTSGATVTLYGHASDLGNLESSWSGATYKSVISSSYFDSRVGLNFPGVSLRWWLLGISDALNSNGYIEIGRVYAGSTVSPDENFSEDIHETFIDPSLQNWTVGGSAYSVSRERYKVFDFHFADLSAANQTIVRTLWSAVYKTEPFVIAFDSTDQPKEFTRYGLFTSDLNFSYSSNLRANTSMTFRELR